METKNAEINLTGITSIVHTYTSGNQGGNISVGLQNYTDDKDTVILKFDAPNGVTVYDVSGCVKHAEGWNVLKIPDSPNQNITVWFKRNGTRTDIKKQELTVSAYMNNTCVSELTFDIEG